MDDTIYKFQLTTLHIAEELESKLLKLSKEFNLEFKDRINLSPDSFSKDKEGKVIMYLNSSFNLTALPDNIRKRVKELFIPI